MKGKIHFCCVIFVFLAFLSSRQGLALDLNGKFVKLGINSDGSLVNDSITLGAVFPDDPPIEFLLPGTPLEGWSVGTDVTNYRSNFAPAFPSEIPVTVIDTSTGFTKSVLVTGTADFGAGRILSIRRTIS